MSNKFITQEGLKELATLQKGYIDENGDKLDSKIKAETERAKGIEGELEGKIEAENQRAIKKEEELDSAIDAEAQRAQQIEEELQQKVDNTPQLEDGLIPNHYLPSYVDDVIDFEKEVSGANWKEQAAGVEIGKLVWCSASSTNAEEFYHKFVKNVDGTQDNLEAIDPEAGKIYINNTNNNTYRWSGVNLVEISKSLAIGETSSTAFAGNRGKALEEKADQLEKEDINIKKSITDETQRATKKEDELESKIQALDAEKVNGHILLADIWDLANPQLITPVEEVIGSLAVGETASIFLKTTGDAIIPLSILNTQDNGYCLLSPRIVYAIDIIPAISIEGRILIEATGKISFMPENNTVFGKENGSLIVYKATSRLGVSSPDILFDLFNEENSEGIILVHPSSDNLLRTSMFYNKTQLEEIHFSNQRLTQIPDSCFQGCINLKKVTGLENVTNIGSSAFRLTMVDNLAFGSLINIGASAFQGCTNLRHISFDDSQLSTIGTNVFYNCSNLQSINFNKSLLNNIPSNAFFNCRSLENITFPNDRLNTIEDAAFQGCCSLVHLNFPIGLVSIGASAFQGCTNLLGFDFEYISGIYSKLMSIGSKAFAKCTSLRSINLSNCYELFYNSGIADDAFNNCIGVEEVKYRPQAIPFICPVTQNLKRIVFISGSSINGDEWQGLTEEELNILYSNTVEVYVDSDTFAYIQKLKQDDPSNSSYRRWMGIKNLLPIEGDTPFDTLESNFKSFKNDHNFLGEADGIQLFNEIYNA